MNWRISEGFFSCRDSVVTYLSLKLENIVFPVDLFFLICMGWWVWRNLCAGFLIIQRWQQAFKWISPGLQQSFEYCTHGNGSDGRQLKHPSQGGRWGRALRILYTPFTGCYPSAYLCPLPAYGHLHFAVCSLCHHWPPHQRPHPWLCRFVAVLYLQLLKTWRHCPHCSIQSFIVLFSLASCVVFLFFFFLLHISVFQITCLGSSLRKWWWTTVRQRISSWPTGAQKHPLNWRRWLGQRRTRWLTGTSSKPLRSGSSTQTVVGASRPRVWFLERGHSEERKRGRCNQIRNVLLVFNLCIWLK